MQIGAVAGGFCYSFCANNLAGIPRFQDLGADVVGSGGAPALSGLWVPSEPHMITLFICRVFKRQWLRARPPYLGRHFLAITWSIF